MAAKRGNFLGASTLMTSLFSTELDQRFQRSSMLLSTIKRALESEDELYLVFQPLVAVASGVCQAAEALLRWSHPVLGEVSPAEFIPLIENTPMARTLTAWVGRRSVRQAALWHGQVRRLRISINVSATNLVEADFAERGLAELHRARLPAEAIKLEVTESALIDKGQAAASQLDALIAAGILIAIDDNLYRAPYRGRKDRNKNGKASCAARSRKVAKEYREP